MDITMSRRALALAACLMGLAWLAPARAEPTTIKVPLSGTQCVPAVQTGGSGEADITYDPATREVSWTIQYKELSSAATMSHFHGPAAPGKNGPVIIWLTTQGTPPTNPIAGKATLTADQAKQFTAGEWYVNLHTQSHPACELRGQVPASKG